MKVIEDLGTRQYHDFRDQRIFKREIPFNDPIGKNKVATFKAANTRERSARLASKTSIFIFVFSHRCALQYRYMEMSLEMRKSATRQWHIPDPCQKIRSGTKSDLNALFWIQLSIQLIPH